MDFFRKALAQKSNSILVPMFRKKNYWGHFFCFRTLATSMAASDLLPILVTETVGLHGLYDVLYKLVGGILLFLLLEETTSTIVVLCNVQCITSKKGNLFSLMYNHYIQSKKHYYYTKVTFLGCNQVFFFCLCNCKIPFVCTLQLFNKTKQNYTTTTVGMSH